MLTVLLLLVILVNFVLLTKKILPIPVGMMLAAGLALILTGPNEAGTLMEKAFSEFSYVATLFTAVAVPAHILQRSSALDYIGMCIGEFIGKLAKRGINPVLLVVTFSMIFTYIMAALFHNTTSILISAMIVTLLCKSYRIPVIPVLGGTLVASNLGGFSTRWGDTPNIIEARTWGLDYSVFFRQILPINIGLIAILIGFITLLVNRAKRNQIIIKNGMADMVLSMVHFRTRKRNIKINKRLMLGGILGLVVAILGPMFFPTYGLILSIVAIIISMAFENRENYFNALYVLGIETYATLLAIFMLARVMADSSIGIGSHLHSLVLDSHAAIWMIVLVSYFGTLLTEAASWASASAAIIHNIDPGTKAAWALGAGICAGSSSLITAATAGIILLNETKENDEDSQMTFNRYLGNGFIFSFIMIIYYIVVLTFIY